MRWGNEAWLVGALVIRIGYAGLYREDNVCRYLTPLLEVALPILLYTTVQ